MKWLHLMCVGGCFALAAATAAAQTPAAAGPCCPPPAIGGPYYNPNQPGVPAPPIVVNPNSNPNPANPNAANPNPANPNPEPSSLSGEAYAQGSEAGTGSAPTVAPAIFGDLIGIRPAHGVVILAHGASVPAGFRRVSGNTAILIAPEPLHASYKIMEGESPLPENRAYVTYTFYDNVDHIIPFSVGGNADLQRETLGLEQTFGNGQNSVGLRLPFLQLTGISDIEDNEVGDLTLIYKHVFVNNRQGDFVSGGLALTMPTGQGLEIAGESTLNDFVFQPFVGYCLNFDEVYVEGFSSLAVPTDMRDVTLLFNSVAVGYRLEDEFRDSPIRAILPQLELHLNTPLSHRGTTSTPVNFDDSLDWTGGVRVEFQRSELGCAVGTPITGPKTYDVEFQANLTFRW